MRTRAAAMVAVAWAAWGCQPAEQDGKLTVRILRGDANPLGEPVDALELSWAGTPTSASARVSLSGARELGVRFALKPPFAGQLTVRGVHAADNGAFSLGRSLPTRVTVDAPVEVSLLMGPIDALTPVGPALPGARMGAALAALGATGALVVGGVDASSGTAVVVEPALAVYLVGEARACSAADGCLSGEAPAGRREAIAVALADGAVVHGLGRLAGGAPDGTLYITTPDGSTRTLASMAPRSGASALALADGTVLVLGGKDAVGSRAEVFRVDPRNGAVTPQPPLLEARTLAGVALLVTGQVLVAGGESAAGAGLATAELYTVGVGSQAADGGAFAQARASLRGPRVAPSVARLNDDTVVLWGGGAGVPEVFRLELGANVGGFVDLVTAPVELRAERPALVALKNGDLFLVGGEAAGTTPRAAWFSPQPNQVLGPLSPSFLGAFRAAGPSSTRRGAASAVELADGSVLVVGGGVEGEVSSAANAPATRVEVLVPGK